MIGARFLWALASLEVVGWPRFLQPLASLEFIGWPRFLWPLALLEPIDRSRSLGPLASLEVEDWPRFIKPLVSLKMKVEQDSFGLSVRSRRLIDQDISGFSLRSSLFDENSKFNLSSEFLTLGDLWWPRDYFFWKVDVKSVILIFKFPTFRKLEIWAKMTRNLKFDTWPEIFYSNFFFCLTDHFWGVSKIALVTYRTKIRPSLEAPRLSQQF